VRAAYGNRSIYIISRRGGAESSTRVTPAVPLSAFSPSVFTRRLKYESTSPLPPAALRNTTANSRFDGCRRDGAGFFGFCDRVTNPPVFKRIGPTLGVVESGVFESAEMGDRVARCCVVRRRLIGQIRLRRAIGIFKRFANKK